MAKHWIQGAIKHKGRLKAAAKRMGIKKGSGPMTPHMAEEVAAKTNDPSLKRAAELGKTLMRRRMHKK